MAKAWSDLAIRLVDKREVRIATVDCTNNAELCMNSNVNAYPTLILFRNGAKASEYTGARDVDSLHSFLAGYLEHDDL